MQGFLKFVRLSKPFNFNDILALDAEWYDFSKYHIKIIIFKNLELC